MNPTTLRVGIVLTLSIAACNHDASERGYRVLATGGSSEAATFSVEMLGQQVEVIVADQGVPMVTVVHDADDIVVAFEAPEGRRYHAIDADGVHELASSDLDEADAILCDAGLDGELIADESEEFRKINLGNCGAWGSCMGGCSATASTCLNGVQPGPNAVYATGYCMGQMDGCVGGCSHVGAGAGSCW